MERLFDWDDAKADANLAKHGISFLAAVAVFADPVLVELDTERVSDREVRRKAIGMIEGRLFTVVFTMRNDMTRIISARRSNTSEKRAYGPFRS